MKNLLGLLVISLFSSIFGNTQIEVAKGKYPFYKIVEWPHHGSLILAKDQSSSKNDIEVNMINHNGEEVWDQIIYPSVENPKLILSDHSDYVYFVENFTPQKNLIHYQQINQAGNVTSTNFDMLKVIRKYGYNITLDLDLIEIVNTPSALVFYFQLPIKNKDIIENIFVSITHHNNRVYDYRAPATDMKLQKKGLVDPILYAGANGSSIYFSYYSSNDMTHTANFIGFEPKGDSIPSFSFKVKNLTPIKTLFKTLNLDGSTFIEDQSKYEARGKGVFIHNKFYFLVNDEKSRNLKVIGENQDGEITILNNKIKNTEDTRNPEAVTHYFVLDGNLVVSSKIEDFFSIYKVSSTSVKQINRTFDEIVKAQLNPSSFKTNNKTSNFVHLINDTPVSTSTENINKQNKIIFK